MFSSNLHDRTILEISQGDYIAITAEAFLIDRQAGELSKKSLKFNKQYLKFFVEHCTANSLNHIGQVTPDFLRRYLLGFSETDNPGGVHAVYRTLRAFFRQTQLPQRFEQ